MRNKSTVISDKRRDEIYNDVYSNKGNNRFDPYDNDVYSNKGNNHFDPYDNDVRTFYLDAKSLAQPLSNDTHLSFAPSSSVPQAYPVPSYTETEPQIVHNHYHNSGIPWWVFLCMNRNSGPVYIAPPTQQREERRDSNFAAAAGIVIIAGAVTLPAVVADFYLLSEVWNNFERLYYNEGYFQAGLGMLNIVVSLSLSAVLTNAVLSSAITALAVSAGFANPISWAFFIMTCVTLFVGAILHLAFQQGIYRMTAAFNPDALHPEEPGRFSITDEQAADIYKRNQSDKSLRELDPNKMQNVITVIHHDIVEDRTTLQQIIQGMVRFSPFFRDANTGEKLAAIRKLRMEGKVHYETKLPDESSLSFNSMSLCTK